MFCLCEDELISLAEESKEVNERTRANMHFKALIELITLLYETDTLQLKEYAEQFTDPKFVSFVLFFEFLISKLNFKCRLF